jgi:hypothetical protein
VVLPAGNGVNGKNTYASPEGLAAGTPSGLPVWDAVGLAETDDGKPLTWYVGATLNSWPGSPLVLVLVLEEDNPQWAIDSGREMMSAALNPK